MTVIVLWPFLAVLCAGLQCVSVVFSSPSSIKIDFGSVVDDLGDNCIQIVYLGRYIVGYTVGNLVLRRRHSNALLTLSLQK